MAIKWLGLAIAIAALVAVALTSPEAPPKGSSSYSVTGDSERPLPDSVGAIEALQQESRTLIESIEWTLYYVDSLFELIDMLEEQLETVQQELDEKMSGSLAAVAANLSTLEQELNVLYTLVQDLRDQDELRFSPEKSYEIARELARKLSVLIEDLAPNSDGHVEELGSSEGGSDD